ncbi:hypothetical protein OROGR_003703 [Orobanche gracilis]
MEDKRIRLVFKDDDILSETQKLVGLTRSWVLLKPHQCVTVSDVASHLLRVFQIHQSCPHGLLLSLCSGARMSGFVLPPFESAHILKDSEIIRVRKRRDILTIAGNNVANDVEKLKAVEKKQHVGDGVLLLANEEFEKEKGGYESEEDDEEGLLKDAENAGPKSHKRKAPEKLRGSKKKRQRVGASKNVEKDVHTEKNGDSLLDGGLTRKKSLPSEEKKDNSNAEDNVENNEETAKLSSESQVHVPGMTRNDDIQENVKEVEDLEIAPKETKKLPSRSARRCYAKRRWLKEMAKIQKQNANCESEGLRNWKEDQTKSKRKALPGHFRGQLHWKQSPQENWGFKSKKRDQGKQNGDILKHTNQNGDVFEKPTQNGDGLEQENVVVTHDDQPGQNNGGLQEKSKQNCDATELLNRNSDGENEVVVPVVVRPGYIRFEPLGKEQAVPQSDVPSETSFQWNGITSKKKGQQWGKESNRSFTPRNDYKNSNIESSEILGNEKEKQPDQGVDFDKLPPLTSMPRERDLIAYRILELSSTWTPELSSYRVGKVSWYNAGSGRTMLLPVPEYPIVSGKDDEDEAVQLDNSLYNEDGSLEIDFSLLMDVRIINNGNSRPMNEAISQLSESSFGNENAAKETVLPGSPFVSICWHDSKVSKFVVEAGGVDVWEQLGEALSAKKEQLSKESGWGQPPKKVQPSPRSVWGKNAQKVQPSRHGSLGKQNSGGKSWSYKGLRGGGLGSTIAILRSKNDNM